MRLGLPTIGQLCLEWWSYEILAILAAGISVKCIAIQVIVGNNGGLFYMPHIGLLVSTQVLIG
jgi:Na+-driven multidrug efflux pump